VTPGLAITPSGAPGIAVLAVVSKNSRWDAAAERRDAQDELHSAAQARAWAGGGFGADHGLAFNGVGTACFRRVSIFN
jgi:hypothetical protein